MTIRHPGFSVQCRSVPKTSFKNFNDWDQTFLSSQGADLREQLDEQVVEKIKELQLIGVRSVAEVRRHLHLFVKEDLFSGKTPPPETSRRYYPADTDIRNILNACRIGDQRSPDDQLNLQIKCDEWQKAHPDDFICYRVCIIVD